jgi:hypothetical protein
VVSRPLTIPFATQSNPAEFREQGNERMINAYATRKGTGKDAEIIIRMSPGQTSFSTSASVINCRGAIKAGDYVYAVFEGGVDRIDSAGTRVSIGAITGTGRVYMALNAAGQIGVVSQLGRYYVIENDNITQVNTSDIGEFNSICWIAGYFILTLRDGRFFNTGINDAYTINGLDFATAEGSPDGLLGGFAHKNELWLFGEQTIDVWALLSSPPASGSPFARQGSWIPKGTLSFASVVEADNTLFWLGNDRITYKNENYNARRISHEGMERAVKNAASASTIEGFTYTIDGHIFYGVSDTNFTWVYDAKERLWHERKSQNNERWKANSFIDAFGKTLVGTIDDGNLYELDMDSRLEGSEEIIWDITSVDNGAIPYRATVSEVEIDFVTGRASLSGTTPQTAPVVSLSYSDDGGQFFTSPRILSLGAHGDYKRRCRAHRLGTTGAKFGRRWRLTGSDPHIMAMSKFKAWLEATG